MQIYLRVSHYLGVMLFIVSMVMIAISVSMYKGGQVVFVEWDIFNMNSSYLVMLFMFDWISLSFLGVVSLISFVVLIYSHIYMLSDSGFNRFILLVYLFVVSMMLMIISPNMFSILLGWDGLGLVSYGLIIYYQNMKSCNAGMLTILSNRIGDIAILMSITWLLNMGSWNFYYLSYMYKHVELSVLMGLVVLAAMTKSAQLPFSAWLPAAMAAPTPVSSLVHSSTLVTAGVYLLIRFSDILGVSFFLFMVALMTMFMSGLSANFEMDLKKIIALSTLSQLGVMMLTLSLGMVELSYFHLLSHALFKSLLFLCAGIYIHSVGNIQDIRSFSCLAVGLPITSLYFVGASLSLCGFPFLSGFYSKDMILENYFLGAVGSLVYLLILVSTIMTMTYSLRLIYYMFKNSYSANNLVYLMEENFMFVPMMILFTLAVIAGSLMNWNYLPIELIILPIFMKMKFILMMFMSLGLIMYFFTSKLVEVLPMNYFLQFSGAMWFVTNISLMLNKFVFKMSAKMFKYLDQGWVEKMGAQGLIVSIQNYSNYSDMASVFCIKNYLVLFLYFLFIYVIFGN